MSKNLENQLKYLKYIASVSNQTERESLLDILSSNPNFIRAVRELCLNLVARNLPLSKECKNKLKTSKRKILCCAKDGVSPQTRKKQIIQAASYLPHLVPHFVSYLAQQKRLQKQKNQVRGSQQSLPKRETIGKGIEESSGSSSNQSDSDSLSGSESEYSSSSDTETNGTRTNNDTESDF